jgi:hypothetical protein
MPCWHKVWCRAGASKGRLNRVSDGLFLSGNTASYTHPKNKLTKYNEIQEKVTQRVGWVKNPTSPEAV